MGKTFEEPGLPEAGASVVDRIKYLITLSRNTQASFSNLIGVDPASLSRVLSGKAAPSDGFLNRIVVNLGVSKDWLRDGSDVPFPKNAHAAVSDAARQGAPVYDIDVAAGNTPLSRMFTEERIVGFMKLPGLNPELPIVRVSGNSMQPRLNPGCYISIRPVPLDAPISWGSIYVVVLSDFRLVKYVRRNANPEFVTLHSENPDFDDIEVQRSKIEALYLVENVINHDFLS
ncbi:MAG: LexA family transcriptional regulator [Muribaculaceae bacterium]|nr:LexA family transcriptional regulator [Muribaculaceae bacterium]